MGPHHPSMHGVLRLIITLDGEDVVDREPILGYLHRGMEKITENRIIIQYLPYVIRWDYLAIMFTEAITVNGPEQLGDIQVPKRASYIRVIMLKLSRIASYLLWLGPFMADIEIRCFDRERDPEWNDFEYRFISKKPSSIFELPRQELYARMEALNGELRIFLIGDQSSFPWRWKIHPSGFINLQILP
ncbi:hypothetical protein Gotur_012912 [Gossypium turneri]